MAPKEKRVGFYLRVSTTGQTVENQRLELERVAAHRGWHVVEEYVDHGISGSKGRDKRPEFDRLCKDAAHGKLDVVAAWSIDRIGRSVEHFAKFINELLEQKVTLYLHQQGVDGTTASGKAMLSMCSVFAEFERAIIIERINAGIDRARKQGKRLGRPISITAKTEQRIRTLATTINPNNPTPGQLYGFHGIAKEVGCGVSTVQRVLKGHRT